MADSYKMTLRSFEPVGSFADLCGGGHLKVEVKLEGHFFSWTSYSARDPSTIFGVYRWPERNVVSSKSRPNEPYKFWPRDVSKHANLAFHFGLVNPKVCIAEARMLVPTLASSPMQEDYKVDIPLRTFTGMEAGKLKISFVPLDFLPQHHHRGQVPGFQHHPHSPALHQHPAAAAAAAAAAPSLSASPQASMHAYLQRVLAETGPGDTGAFKFTTPMTMEGLSENVRKFIHETRNYVTIDTVLTFSVIEKKQRGMGSSRFTVFVTSFQGTIIYRRL